MCEAERVEPIKLLDERLLALEHGLESNVEALRALAQAADKLGNISPRTEGAKRRRDLADTACLCADLLSRFKLVPKPESGQG